MAQDLDGDGRADVGAVNGTSSDLSLFLGNGAGAFAAAAGSPLATGSGPSGAAVADFNGDGRPDIAVSNYVSQSVTVLLGKPGGGWSAEAAPPSAPGAGAIAAADVNGDGRPDLLVPDYNAGGVSVLLRRPVAGFELEGTAPTGVNPRAIAVADFNGDGRPDLAVTNFGGDSVTVLLRQALGGFAVQGAPIAVGSHPSGIVARDLNGDGLPDLAVANYGSGNVSLLLNAGGAGFVTDPASPAATGEGATGIAAADFDGDGRTDLAVTNHGSNTMVVLLRQAGGGYAPDPSSPIGLPAGAAGVAAADLDGDGRPDLVATSDQADVLSVFLNRTAGPAPPAPAAAAPAGSTKGTITVVGVPGKSLGIPGAGGKISRALQKALERADLGAQMARAAASSQVSRQAGGPDGPTVAGLESRLDSYLYGIPIAVRGTPGSVVDISAAMAIASRSGQKGAVTTIQLPPLAAYIAGASATVRIPVDPAAARALEAAGVKEAAIAATAKEVDKQALDLMSELEARESQQLQQATERYNQMMQAISNIMRKLKEATDASQFRRPNTHAPSRAELLRRAASLSRQANATAHTAAALLAPTIRNHPTASPRVTFAIKPCARRCSYPRFGRRPYPARTRAAWRIRWSRSATFAVRRAASA
ncbi:MAG: VCBS repeat-containing protein [Actinobacteria bacterium]|nr:VCBS repeat-containing protein [Actinomycetota bacterium]